MSAELRIAIRAEGQMINAYVAMANSMEGAIPIGSISRVLCDEDETLFDQFKALMTMAGTTLIEQLAGGKVLEVFERDAPEHEKAGSA
jgi:hypothetical protein